MFKEYFLRKKIEKGEVKVWTSKDYYVDKDTLGSNGHIEKKEESEDINNNISANPPRQIKQYPNLIVCLDNGHASSTPGKRSSYLCSGVLPPLELYEYDFNRKVTAVLQKKLEQNGITVFMVCPERDKDISLTTRYTRANNFVAKNPGKKGLLISVHANAHGDGKSWTNARGWCAYTTKGQNNSDKLAECLYEEAERIFLSKKLSIRTDFTDKDRDWESNFTIIYGANMPAVLTENFFYTNVDDCAYLLTAQGIEDIAEVHYQAILKFAEQQYNM